MFPKEPAKGWIHSFMAESLIDAPGYKIDTTPCVYKLDQNESPWDWPLELKQRILAQVADKPWNRYPSALSEELSVLIGNKLGLPPQCIVTGAGSNYLITLLLECVGRHRQGDLRILQPSFPLFEMHCRYTGIAYKTWQFAEDFRFDTAALDDLPDGSVVVLASPNNPTGSMIAAKELGQLLSRHPSSLFILDEAYYEFSDEPASDLMNACDNLVIVRTFSKTFGAAGIRGGYVIGSVAFTEQFRKLRLPFMMNHFAETAIMCALTDPDIEDFIRRNVHNAKMAREDLYLRLTRLFEGSQHRVYPSAANFLMVQLADPDSCDRVYQGLIRKGLLVRNISKGPGLSGCLRISVGDEQACEALYLGISQIVGSLSGVAG